jgi:hypothetical protein
MAAVAMRARSQWRAHRASLLVVAALVACAGAVTMTTLAGARRTVSVTDRFRDATHPPTVFVDLARTGDFDGATDIARLDDVREWERLAAVAVVPPGGQYAPLLARAGGSQGVAMDTGILVDGRRARAEAVDEVALSESQARLFDVDVGDRLELGSLTPRQWRICETDEDACGREVAAPAGPHVTLRVVGIVRGTIDLVGAGDFSYSFLPPAFFDRYRREMAWGGLMQVRLREGADTDAFVAAARDAVPAGVEPVFEVGRPSPVEDAARVYGVALAIFGALTAAVGAFVVAQAVARHAQAQRGERETLVALGTTRTTRALGSALTFAPAAVLGSAAAVAAAYAASTWMPRGLARRAEPSPGRQLDGLVLGGGALFVAAAVVAAAFVAHLWVERETPARARRTPLAGRLGASFAPAVAVGVRHAFHADRGERAVPVRSARVACAVAAGGAVAALAFGAALTHLVDTPRLQGWAWDAAGLDDDRATDVVDDPGVEATAEVTAQIPVRVEGYPIYGLAVRPLDGAMPWPMVSGREPRAPDEVALGADTLAEAGARVGERVEIGGERADVTATVVGVAVFPPHDESFPLADGVLLAPELADRLGGAEAGFRQLAVRLRPAADRDATLARLREANGGQPLELPSLPAEVDRLAQIEHLPRLVGGAVALLGALGVAHALALTVRRRGRDFAVLRVLGLRPRDVGVAVLVQAALLAVAGAAVGLPTGVLGARAAWGAVARSIGVATVHRVPAAAVVGPALGVLVVAAAVALPPARRAARLAPARTLRSE